MGPFPTYSTALAAPLRSLMQAHGIGTVPVMVMPDNGIRYGFDPGKVAAPEPLVRFERSAVVALCAAEEAHRNRDAGFPRDAVLAGGISDGFIAAWSDVRAVLDHADRMHSIGGGVRRDKLDDFVRTIAAKSFQHAAVAMIAEYDAAHYLRTGHQDKAMEGMGTSATAWLNSVRQASLTGLLGRHLVSRSIFHSCFGGYWHTAEIAFMHSSRMYLEEGDRESAADERIRAAHTHSMRPQATSAMLTRHLGEALEWLGAGLGQGADAKREALFALVSEWNR